jgi:hypothetical protein
MTTFYSFLKRVKPGIPKRYLLFVAAVVWTFAGGMLLFRGFTLLNLKSGMLWEKISGSLVAGIIFYAFMFSKISLKHTKRIVNLTEERPCAFSFFNWTSYFLMSIMISFGITLRVTGIVPASYLSLFYMAMGTPLFISAFRFYYYGFNYKKATILK